MTGQYLVFRSNHYPFAVPASDVEFLAECSDPQAVSFSQLIFGIAEEEPYLLVLRNGARLSVRDVCEMVQLEGTILPLPGYVFEGNSDWLRGMIWENENRVLVLNSGWLRPPGSE